MDKIEVSKKNRPEDFSSMIGGIFSGIKFKIIILIFISYIFLHNDIFISRVLSRIDGAVGELGKCPTTKGTIILGILLVIFYILIDAANRLDII